MLDEQVRTVLAQRPCGLMTDIDGTISPIAPTPEAAVVSPIARQALQQLAQQIELVAAISGRAAADAARMVDLPELTYVGNHGMEIWQQGVSQPVPEAQVDTDAIAQVLSEAQAHIALCGVQFEDKGVTATVHYRQAADPAEAEALIGAVLQRLVAEHHLWLTRGHMIWEIRPPLAITKGTAVQRLVDSHQLRSAIFIGDDRTDADAFTVLRELRDRGTCATLAVGVQTPETPQIVLDQADLLVAGVSGVEHMLATMVRLITAPN